MRAKNAIRNAGTIHAGTLHVGDRTTIRVVKGGRQATPYPDGCIGANLPKHNYVKYLVERYHDYREADMGFGRKERIHYAVLFKNIEAKFKAPTYFIPVGRFEALVDYLHSRIDKTILGRRNLSRGIRNFESFDEYKMQHMAAAGA
ncbi:MAG: hypothetical protein ACHRHE_18000 [Tepidisphaerales bacterium]